jgi:hypothetical protein
MRAFVTSTGTRVFTAATAAILFSGVALAADAGKGTQAYQVRHEISWGMKYGALSESAKPETDGVESKATINNLGFSVSYGYLGRGSVEPLFELGYLSRTAKVGDVEEKGSSMSYGLGALFNLTSAENDATGMPFNGRRWVPYGGFLLASQSSSGSQTATTSLKTDSGDLTTILVGGVRFVAFENVALNSQLRFSYTQSRNVGTAEAASGGTITRLTYELTPFNVSILF